MKARVKATGEIVEVKSKVITSFTGEHRLKYIDQKTGISYFEEELFFPKNLADDPDYWTRLEHQAAIAAMQAQMAPNCLDSPEGVACTAYAYAHALVEKMKEERK